MAIWHAQAQDADEQARRAYACQHYLTRLCRALGWPRLWEVLDTGAYERAKLRHDPSTRSVVLDLDMVRQTIVAQSQEDEEKGRNARSPNSLLGADALTDHHLARTLQEPGSISPKLCGVFP
jgi:hypothetical protein